MKFYLICKNNSWLLLNPHLISRTKVKSYAKIFCHDIKFKFQNEAEPKNIFFSFNDWHESITVKHILPQRIMTWWKFPGCSACWRWRAFKKLFMILCQQAGNCINLQSKKKLIKLETFPCFFFLNSANNNWTCKYLRKIMNCWCYSSEERNGFESQTFMLSRKLRENISGIFIRLAARWPHSFHAFAE